LAAISGCTISVRASATQSLRDLREEPMRPCQLLIQIARLLEVVACLFVLAEPVRIDAGRNSAAS